MKYALRTFRKNPGFVAVAVCSLAIGIGANSAIYSFAYAMLLRPLPVLMPSRVVAVAPVTTAIFGAQSGLSYPDYLDFRDRNRTFQGLVACSYSTWGFAANRSAAPRMKFGMYVSGNFFQVLGVDPKIGRGFRPAEDQAEGRDPVAVISHDFWISEFDARLSAVGSKLWLNGTELTIVGVAPESFTGTDQFIRPTLYVPLSMSPRLGTANLLKVRDSRWLTVKGRLKPDIGVKQAAADLAGIAAALRHSYPKEDENLHVKVETQLQLQAEASPPDTALILMLGLLALCVLLVACANVAGLLLSRATVRKREIAVRLAIGGSRAWLIRQLLTESLLLALAGGAAGLAIAYAAVEFFKTIPVPPSDVPFKLEANLDSGALLFTAAIAIASTLLFGLVPALRVTRPNLIPALKASDTDSSKKGRLWGRNFIVGGQIALSLVLLIVSGVLVQGFRSQLTQGPGFRTDHLFLMSFDPALIHYSEAQQHQFYRQLLDQARRAPGVKSAALAASIPMGIGGNSIGVIPEGYQLKKGQEVPVIFNNVVSDGYFSTMGIPLDKGRAFLPTDELNKPAVAVVNQNFARRFWPNQDALGKRFHLRSATGPLLQVVGIARNSKYFWISESPTDYLYLPYSQNPQSAMALITESGTQDAAVISPVLRRLVQSLDRNMPTFDTRSMSDLYHNRAVKTPEFLTKIVGSLGFMGLVLALVGLYGLIAYSVSRRTREIGIRMAVGADRRKVVGMVIRQGLWLGIAGVIVGLAVGIFAERAITSMMIFSFGKVAVWPFVLAPALLLLTTTLAAYAPARRASSIDPMRALRDE